MQKQVRRSREAFPEEDEYNPYLDLAQEQTLLARDHIGRNIHKLQPGDHIGWERFYIIFHHAIVIEVKSESIEVFHFSKDKKEKRIKILKEEKNNSENCFLYRFNYPSYVLKRNPPHVVFQRATCLMLSSHQESYNLYSNNCEHFATFCKTGKSHSCQIQWLMKNVEEAEVLSSGLGWEQIGRQVARDGLERYTKPSVYQTLRETGKCPTKRVVFGASTLSERPIVDAQKTASEIASKSSIEVGGKVTAKFASTSKGAMIEYATRDTGRIWGGATKAGKICTRVGTVVGAVVTAVVDIVSTGYDIYNYKKLKDAGKMSKEDFKKNVTERVCEGAIGSIATIAGDLGGMKVGALAGAGIGCFFGPVGAVVGAGIGAVSGAIIGSLVARGVGKTIGRFFGRLIGRFF
ncbi:uncharacterized protein LOC128241713 [Mya arenaria]|uniref:uncharacterized protein LOC128241713 n=1 Tax=Mya arenaria TaxID=6604 RepID=UPI0022E410DC|nr:uncharacterized protein LOC128241713 [Mya arenaria]XP_052814713.1 uncharacterized protein LOC128241713 [Mya arenaria]XP_052814714.1 uncharacterized protein LOC128241713 [Mya arenaria]XP_052814715.1 uncharacterized protein LOC128241713 [Mya arenaria]XP_052814716.1 uncharacterized protein LOC128241713 [Mya arenaria]